MADPNYQDVWASQSKYALNLSDLIKGYASLQNQVVSMVNNLASSISSANPAQFLLVQFGMSQVNQVGQSISNIIYQVNSVCMAAVRNQKSQ